MIWYGCVGLEADDCGVVVDDGLVLGADVVAVLEDAAKHEPGDVVDAQVQCGLGEGFQDARNRLVHDTIHTLDELVNQLLVVAHGALVALGKGDVSMGDGLL